MATAAAAAAAAAAGAAFARPLRRRRPPFGAAAAVVAAVGLLARLGARAPVPQSSFGLFQDPRKEEIASTEWSLPPLRWWGGINVMLAEAFYTAV